MRQSLEIFKAETEAAFRRQAEQIELLNTLDDNALLHRPAHGGWNAAECFEHLSLTYDHYLPQLKNKPASASTGAYRTSWVMGKVINSLRPGNAERPRFRMKTFRDTNPLLMDGEPRKALDRFHRLHAQFHDCVKEIDDVGALNAKVITLAGPLIRFKAGDAVKFLLAHNDRHLKQAARACKDPGR